MRIQPIFILAVVSALFCGCAARKRADVVEQIDSSQPHIHNTSTYWDGCDSCDSSDSNVTSSDGYSAASLPPASKSTQSELSCSACGAKQDMLIDGTCVSCLRQQRDQQPFSGFKKSSDVASPLPSGGFFKGIVKQAVTDKSSKLPEQTQSNDFLPNKLPPKSTKSEVTSKSVPKVIGQIEQAIGDVTNPPVSRSQPAFIQAKDVVKNELKNQLDGISGQLESSRNEIKDSLDSISSVVESAPQPTTDSLTEPLESPLTELLSLNQDRGKGMTDRIQSKPATPLEGESAKISAPLPDQKKVPSPESPFIVGEIQLDTKRAGDLSPEPTRTVERSEVQSQQTVNTSKPPRSLSGSASAFPDPKFETFRLDDLFPGVKEKKKNNTGKASKVEKTQPPKNVTSMNSKPRRSARSEAEVVADLKSNTIPNHVVFDNTPVIAEQQVQEKLIVLQATPMRSYSNLQQIAKRKEPPAILTEPTTLQAESASNEGGRAIENVRIIPVNTESRMMREPINFSPLPQMNELMNEVDLSVGNSVPENVFDPTLFPEVEMAQAEDLEAEFNFEFDGPMTSSLAPGETISTIRAQSLPPVDKGMDVYAEFASPLRSSAKQAAPILLRAVPASSRIGNSIKVPPLSNSKATFKFVQPKFQRRVEE